MRVSFVGRVATNHTAFIRIKASQPAPSQELLILPVEVEVLSGKKTCYFSLLFTSVPVYVVVQIYQIL